MNLNQFFKDHPRTYRQFPVIVCKDGLRLSVQASFLHYCAPRHDKGPWTEVEVACASVPADLAAFHSPADSFRHEVFPWVPVGKVEAVIEAHGGMVGVADLLVETGSTHE